MFGGSFAPLGWAFCHGQALAISEYDALHTLIGETYGGDGQTYFNVPDLEGRIPVGIGSTTFGIFTLAEKHGQETITLLPTNLPVHNHPITGSACIPVSGEDGHRTTPGNNYPAVNGQNIYSTTSDGSQMALPSIYLTSGSTGSAQPEPFNIVQPYLAIHYIICLEGIYPTT
jgi:microcystin-dependent protein